MITENLSTLKIHKLTQKQYDRELESGNIDETAIYLTPDEPNIFYATINETTFTEIAEAYLSGKEVRAIENGESCLIYCLTLANETSFIFVASLITSIQAWVITSDNVWQNASQEIITSINGVYPNGNDISLSPTDILAAHENHKHTADDIIGGTLAITKGGTGATTAEEALANLGIADYMIESGKTDVNYHTWYYQKYQSGIIEMWTTSGASYQNGNVAWANETYPFTLAYVTAAFASLNDTNNSSDYLSYNTKISAGLTSCRVVLHSTVANLDEDYSYPVSILIKGMWKDV